MLTKSQFISLTILSAVSATAIFSSKASAFELFPDQLPQEFAENFQVNVRTGQISAKNKQRSGSFTQEVGDKAGQLRVFNKAEGASGWHVGSKLCSKNKELTCLSLYRRESYKVNGNQMNPFAPADHKGEYVLYQINTKNPLSNTAIKCRSQLTSNMTLDDASLKSCAVYSKNTCDRWKTVMNKYGSQFSQKAEECSEFMKNLDQVKKDMAAIFQSDLPQLKEELSSNFDDATRMDKGLRLSPNVKFETNSFQQSVLNFKDIFDKTENCETYAYSLFSEKSSYERYLSQVFSNPNNEGRRLDKRAYPEDKANSGGTSGSRRKPSGNTGTSN